jgi:hypothetical protein
MEFNVPHDSNLRIIKTVNDIDELNRMIALGHKVEVHEVKQIDELFHQFLILKNRKSGHLIEAKGRHFYTREGLVEYSYEDWETVCESKEYIRPRSLEYGYRGYVLPLDVKIDEMLFVEDLIQDIYVDSFWDTPIYAADGVATWDGERLIFHETLWDEGQCQYVG